MRFALAGNPNSGKTTLFNALTGSTAHVGNWPGVTVEKKSGYYKKLGEKIEIIDLPGIYSLSPYTPEEIVSRNYVLEEKPDCIINIVDSTNLLRNLYLTTQLNELDIPMIVALNMSDVAEKNGDFIDAEKLSEELNVKAVKISALKGSNIKELMEEALKCAKEQKKGVCVVNDGTLKGIYKEVYGLYEKENIENAVFHTVKMIEGDSLETEKFPDIEKKCSELKEKIDTGDFEGDFEGVVADLRYKYIDKHYEPSLKKSNKMQGMTKSDKADKVLTHKIWGIPIFLLIMFAVFHLTFSENLFFIGYLIPEGSFDIPILGTDAINSPGVILFNVVDWITSSITQAVSGAMPEGTWYTSLICDGLLSGVFSVLSFIPQILVLFLFLSILEDSGYMARVAFIMDRAFRKFGLSGKAFMPLLMCFGCAVPGIMATRTLENENERKRAICIAPFFSCGAKLPIWAAFAGVFAQVYSGLNAELIVFSMYLIGIVVAIIGALILKLTVAKGDTPPFIMELPNYHAPQFKNLMLHLWDKLKHYIFRAATIIAGAVVVIWFLSSFNFEWQFVEDSGQSILGSIAKLFTWIFVPLGFAMGDDGWKFVVAAITGLIAKEMVVSTLGVFSGLQEDALEMEASDIVSTPLGIMMTGIGGGVLGGVDIAIPAMFSFMCFNLLSVPCMAAVAAASGELNSKKKLWTAIAFWMLTAYLVSLFVFWFGVLATVLWWAALIVGLVIVALVVTLAVLSAKNIIKMPKFELLKKLKKNSKKSS